MKTIVHIIPKNPTELLEYHNDRLNLSLYIWNFMKVTMYDKGKQLFRPMTMEHVHKVKKYIIKIVYSFEFCFYFVIQTKHYTDNQQYQKQFVPLKH